MHRRMPGSSRHGRLIVSSAPPGWTPPGIIPPGIVTNGAPPRPPLPQHGMAAPDREDGHEEEETPQAEGRSDLSAMLLASSGKNARLGRTPPHKPPRSPKVALPRPTRPPPPHVGLYTDVPSLTLPSAPPKPRKEWTSLPPNVNAIEATKLVRKPWHPKPMVHGLHPVHLTSPSMAPSHRPDNGVLQPLAVSPTGMRTGLPMRQPPTDDGCATNRSWRWSCHRDPAAHLRTPSGTRARPRAKGAKGPGGKSLADCSEEEENLLQDSSPLSGEPEQLAEQAPSDAPVTAPAPSSASGRVAVEEREPQLPARSVRIALPPALAPAAEEGQSAVWGSSFDESTSRWGHVDGSAAIPTAMVEEAPAVPPLSLPPSGLKKAKSYASFREAFPSAKQPGCCERICIACVPLMLLAIVGGALFIFVAPIVGFALPADLMPTLLNLTSTAWPDELIPASLNRTRTAFPLEMSVGLSEALKHSTEPLELLNEWGPLLYVNLFPLASFVFLVCGCNKAGESKVLKRRGMLAAVRGGIRIAGSAPSPSPA